ncbi:MAG: ParA family protein [Chromatiaceae bacterium]|nr:MAG: ParA family protein [Chromatiaceae bacterium]
MKSVVFFNNKGGVGKTTLTFNIAHVLAGRGVRVVVLDFDPQCNISAIFLDEIRLFEIWEDGRSDGTVTGCLEPVRRGKGDVLPPRLERVADGLWLLPGHLALSRFEQTLAEEFAKTLASDNDRALDVTTSLDLLSNLAAEQVAADVMIMDLGPSLGALNRAALLACDHLVLPVAPDLFSLQGLRNVGPTLREWRRDWGTVRERGLTGKPQETLPPHDFLPLGYMVQQHLARADRPVAGYARWAQAIPAEYRRSILDEAPGQTAASFDKDEHCLALIPHYASLVPIAQQARKPIFDLKQADGIGGGQIQAVARCRDNFNQIGEKLLERLGIDVP